MIFYDLEELFGSLSVENTTLSFCIQLNGNILLFCYELLNCIYKLKL